MTTGPGVLPSVTSAPAEPVRPVAVFTLLSVADPELTVKATGTPPCAKPPRKFTVTLSRTGRAVPTVPLCPSPADRVTDAGRFTVNFRTLLLS